MPIYFRIIILAFVFLLQGCSAKSAHSDIEDSINTDALTLNGIYAEQMGENSAALEFYNRAYEISANPNIKYRSVAILIKKRKFYEALEILKKLEQTSGGSEISDRMMISAYTHLGDLGHALKKGDDLLKRDRSPDNLSIVASIEFALKNYQKSIELFTEAYEKGDEDSILKITDTYYHFLKDQNRAKTLINSEIEKQGCSFKLCNKLLSYLNPKENSEEMIDIYKKLYQKYDKQEFATAAAEIMVMNKELDRAADFLEESSIDQEMLLDIYKFQKEYDKAYKLSLAIYKDNPTMKNLSQIAFIEYEMSQDKNNPEMLESVMSKLKKVVVKVDDDTIDNFYGYLLIDHDIDVDKGLTYVIRALKIRPDSPYYLDSLAWGMYKQGRCLEAKEYIDRAYEELKGEEIELHKELIEKCIKEKH